MAQLTIKVVPGASRTHIAGWLGSALKIRLMAAPENGQANQAVIALLAEALDVSADRIMISSGATSPNKKLLIFDLSEDQLRSRLAASS